MLTRLGANIAPLLTSLGLFLTFWALRANHDWNRRNFAALMVAQWNDETSSHRKAIEQHRPGLVDIDRKSNAVTELTKQDSHSIYTATPDTPEWQLRFHFIELLNHHESIASPYRNAVGDRQIIEESFRQVLIKWRDILVNFIVVVNEHRGYEPWEPFTTVVEYWKRKPFKPRPDLIVGDPAAGIQNAAADRSHDEAFLVSKFTRARPRPLNVGPLSARSSQNPSRFLGIPTLRRFGDADGGTLPQNLRASVGSTEVGCCVGMVDRRDGKRLSRFCAQQLGLIRRRKPPQPA